MGEKPSPPIPVTTRAHRELAVLFQQIIQEYGLERQKKYLPDQFTVDTFHHSHSLVTPESIAVFIDNDDLLFILILEDLLTMPELAPLMQDKTYLGELGIGVIYRSILEDAIQKWEKQIVDSNGSLS